MVIPFFILHNSKCSSACESIAGGAESKTKKRERKSSKNIHKREFSKTFYKYNEPLKVLNPSTPFSVRIHVCVGVYVCVKVYGGRKLTKRMSSIAFDVFFGECASRWMYSLPIAKKGWLISLRDLPAPLRNPCRPPPEVLPPYFLPFVPYPALSRH